MTMKQTRSPLARAGWLGSAKDGVDQWWQARLSAVALVPLGLWFVVSIVVNRESEYATVIAWLKTPFAAVMMVLLLIAVFHHTALGLQVIIEDYVHSPAKFPALIAVRLACVVLAIVGIFAVLLIAFRG